MEKTSAALDRAQLLITARRYDQALQILSRIPEDGEARLLSSAAYFYEHDLRRALEEVERSIALLPGVPEPHAFRSDVLHALGRKKASLDAAREAVRLQPADARFQWAMARSAWAVRDWKSAEAAAAETMRLAPEWSLSHGIVGLIAAGRRRRKEAQAHFRDALRLDPTDPSILNDLAASMPRLRPRTQSVKLLEEAVRLDPSDRLIVDNLYIETSAHIRGYGFDRLDLFMLTPTLVCVALTAVIFFGWVHPPAIVSLAALALTLTLTVAYAIADFMRNRGRMRSLKPGTRALYLRRFYRDHFLSLVYFVITFGIPALAVGIVDSALGLPSLVQWLGLFVVIVAWALLGPRGWHSRVRPWLARGR